VAEDGVEWGTYSQEVLTHGGSELFLIAMKLAGVRRLSIKWL